MSLPSALGSHLLLDLSAVAPTKLCDLAGIEQALRAAALAAGATAIHAHFHPFGEGQGITGVLLLRESHISIHTWPEHGFAAIDIFMCGEAQPERAAAALCAWFAGRVEQRCALRGGSLARV